MSMSPPLSANSGRCTAQSAARTGGWPAWSRIRKRLGGLRHKEIRQLLHDAHAQGETERHKAWIERLLVDYYDPMYDYQLRNKRAAIVFCGNADAARTYLTALD